ncbi:MAG: ATP-binding protein [Candidatus Gracilibacteria bacterium]|nr:ATP-binding protein [Candidatus Gracilibacteria bacterium]
MFNDTKNQIIEVIKRLNEGNSDFSFFIGPVGYTLIKTFYDNNGIDIKPDTICFSRNTRIFLYDLGFFDIGEYCISSTKRKKILPIKTVNSQYGENIDNISNEFYGILSEYLGVNNKQLINNITKMIGELLNNICNHSGTPDVNDNTGEVIISANYQSGQYFQRKNFIQISIVDSGVGILSSVRKKVPGINNSEDAIKKALECGFTGGTTLEKGSRNFSGMVNAGVGLTTTLEIIKVLGGDIFIGTKDCLYSYDGKEDKESFEKMDNWKGTFVVFNIYTDTDSDVNFDKLRIDLLGKSKNDSKFEKSIDFG